VCGKVQAPAALPPWKELTYTKKDTKWDDPESKFERRGEKSLHSSKIIIQILGNGSVNIDVLVCILWVEYKEGMIEGKVFRKICGFRR
jgi:hypothetical protein